MTDRRQFIQAGAAAGAAVALPSAFAQPTQGVSKNEIVFGSLQDLSGPLVAIGKPVRDGMTLRVEQINAQGGIHGRKLKVVVDDSGYDPKKAVLAAQKMLSQDKIFAMVGSLGTPVALATLPLCLERNVAHLFPLAPHKGTYEPLHPLKFQAFAPYQDQAHAGLREMVKQKGYKRVGIMYQDDEYGQEVLRGAELALKDVNMTMVEKTTYKRGATEFSSQMQKLKAANPDMIVLGTVIRETIGAMATARQLGYGGDFFGISAVYMPATARAGGKAVEGLYAMSETPTPYRDDPKNNKLLNEWMDAYKARFKEDADLWGVAGWAMVDMFIKAVEKAGPNLTWQAFSKSMESLVYPRSFLGTPDYAFTAQSHLGNRKTRIFQIQSGRWVVYSDFLNV
jgi:ABC-type branched-subunit amino acid transport system substrate-binding protein